jgi:hypothetical protein
MANYTNLCITAYGDIPALYQFDKTPPTFEGPEITIEATGSTRIIQSEFKSIATSHVLYGLSDQIKGLSQLILIEIEPAFSCLLHKGQDQSEFQALFEIPDYRDDDFFKNLHPKYLEQFHKPILTLELIQLLSLSTTGNTYLDLILNPETYLNK